MSAVVGLRFLPEFAIPLGVLDEPLPLCEGFGWLLWFRNRFLVLLVGQALPIVVLPGVWNGTFLPHVGRKVGGRCWKEGYGEQGRQRGEPAARGDRSREGYVGIALWYGIGRRRCEVLMAW